MSNFDEIKHDFAQKNLKLIIIFNIFLILQRSLINFWMLYLKNISPSTNLTKICRKISIILVRLSNFGQFIKLWIQNLIILFKVLSWFFLKMRILVKKISYLHVFLHFYIFLLILKLLLVYLSTLLGKWAMLIEHVKFLGFNSALNGALF